jgi:hypothetical protein
VIRVILAGEGRNELGDLAIEEEYRPRALRPGVVEALLREVRRDGWEIVDALPWKKLPKLQVGIGKKGEEHNVRRAYHHARKRGCDVFVFTRDRDSVKFSHRDEDIERAIDGLTANGEDGSPAIVGGVAIEKLESWLVALAGDVRSEEARKPEERLHKLGIADKDTAAMVIFVETRGLAAIPDDARSLRRWLTRAREALKTPEIGWKDSESYLLIPAGRAGGARVAG